MPTDLTVVLDDRAGQLAHMGEALGDAGVAIEGFSATTTTGSGSCTCWSRTRWWRRTR